MYFYLLFYEDWKSMSDVWHCQYGKQNRRRDEGRGDPSRKDIILQMGPIAIYVCSKQQGRNLSSLHLTATAQVLYYTSPLSTYIL